MKKRRGNWLAIVFLSIIIGFALSASILYSQYEERPVIGKCTTDVGLDALKHTYVYLGASSKVFEAKDALTEQGLFVDLFTNSSELAELIDNEGFPYKAEYFAVTSAQEPTRYLITTTTGSDLWVEP